jgi:hypothetical protein
VSNHVEVIANLLEGNRTFDIALGTLTGAICLALAIPILLWSLPSHRRRLFSPSVDPHGILQIAYGVFCMAMAWADALCRFIPHGPLAWVHPAFFVTTLLIGIVIGRRVLALVQQRSASHDVSAKTVRNSRLAPVAVLACLAAIPLVALWHAFGPGHIEVLGAASYATSSTLSR